MLVAGKRFLVVGHRGAAARAPENTAVSLEAGLDSGADAIEIDVGLSRDGRAVLLHDTTLDRTTDARGPLRGKDWAALARVDAGARFASRFRGEPLIDLDDALAIVRPRAAIIVEVKAVGDRDDASRADRATVDAALAAFSRTGGLRGVTLSSSCWPILAYASSRAAGLDVALTVGFSERRDPIGWAHRTGASTLHPNHLLCSSAYIERAHAAGLGVIPYTVNRVGKARSLAATGADGIFTDDPRAMIRHLAADESPGDARALVLGIDQGSGGTRAVLVDRSGDVVASRSVAVGSRRGRSGAIVQDPLAIAASVVRAAAAVADGARREIACAGLAVQRSSILVWRKSDVEPLTPVASWRAGRPYVPPPALARLEDRIRRATGLTARYPYGAIRLAALLTDHADLARGLASGRYVAGPLGAFLVARLCGRSAAACDPSLAQRTLAFDLRHGSFSHELCEALGVPVDCWPPVAASARARGALRLGRRRIPMRALLGDVGSAARACVGPVADARTGVLVLGTGGFVVVPTGRRRRAADGLLTTLLYEDRAGPVYGLEGTVHGLASGLARAGASGGWDSLPVPRIAARGAAAARVPAVVAALEGTGTPDWDVTPRFDVEAGSFTPEEIVRGTLEDLASRFGRISDLLREAGALPQRFVATGGLAFSPHLVARISDRMGVPVDVDARTDRTAAGAALLASHGR